MKIRALLLVSAILIFTVAATASAATYERMVTSITTTDLNRAAMAIKFTHMAMKKQQVPATLFLNVDGVRLADTRIPSAQHPTGQTLRQMITAFMADGGTVIACPMCMKNVGGMTNSNLMEGVKARKGAAVEAMFAPGTLVLSY